MKNHILSYRHILLWLTFVMGSFTFFEVNYKYWYKFMEQYLMFQTTEAHFMERLTEPGGMTQYLTEFLSLAFVYPFGASLVIALLLGSISAAFYGYLKACRFEPSMLTAILPVFLFWIYPQESIAPMLTVLFALLAAMLYASIHPDKLRYLYGFIALTTLYFFTAPASLLAAILMAIAEVPPQKVGGKWIAVVLLLAYGAVLPLIAMRTCYILPMREAYFSKHLCHPEFPIPMALGWIGLSFPLFTLYAFIRKEKRYLKNEILTLVFSEALLLAGIAAGIVYQKNPLEQAYLYDYYARQAQWKEIVDHAKVHSIHDMDALVYLNLALSHTGQFADLLLQFPQKGEAGFIPHDPRSRMGLIQASEVAWQVGQINAAQRFAFVGVLSSERCVQPRLMKRLVETYLVTGEYRIAEKYIKLLEATPNYREWATAQRPLLNPEVCASTDWVAQKRKFLPITDNPFDLTKTLTSALAFLIDDHPDNRAAFEYGMGYLLAYKDLGTFMHYMQLMRDRGESFPVRYQEAICIFYSAIQKNPNELNRYPISKEVKDRFMEYAQAAKKFHPGALKRQFGDTYYYYLQYGPNLNHQ